MQIEEYLNLSKDIFVKQLVMAPVSANSETKSGIKEKSKGTRKLLITLKKTMKSINMANTVQQISNMHPIRSNTRRTKRMRDEESDLSPNRLDQSVTPAKKSKMKQCFVVTPKEMRTFFHLLGNSELIKPIFYQFPGLLYARFRVDIQCSAVVFHNSNSIFPFNISR